MDGAEEGQGQLDGLCSGPCEEQCSRAGAADGETQMGLVQFLKKKT